jgi:hypothetical protein
MHRSRHHMAVMAPSDIQCHHINQLHRHIIVRVIKEVLLNHLLIHLKSNHCSKILVYLGYHAFIAHSLVISCRSLLFLVIEGVSLMLKSYRINENGSLLPHRKFSQPDNYKALRAEQNQAWAKER